MKSRVLVLGPALAGLGLLALALLAGAGSASRGGDAALAAAAAAPAPDGRPAIVGAARAGETLTASNGTWSGTAPINYAYQWQACDAKGAACADIDGATNNTLKLADAQVGKTVGVAVTATNADGSATAYSDLAGPVAPAGSVPAYTTQPAISGAAKQGEKLTVSNGVWSGTTPMTFAYQWQRCDAAGKNCDTISDATSSTYTLAAADVGHTVLAAVKATNSLGTQTGFTKPTGVVEPTIAPGATVAVSSVSLPNRLVVSGVAFDPTVVHRSTTRFTARFRVSDSNGHPVSGALVYAIGLPYGRVSAGREVQTDANGFASIDFSPTVRFSARRGYVVFFVRARKPGENLLGGVSTRRLVQVTTAA